MRPLLCSAALLLGLLSAGLALAATASTDSPVDVSVDAAPGVELGDALQVARGQVVRSADGRTWLLLGTGTQMPVQWPAGVALPLGSMVVVSGTPNPAGPLLVDHVFPVQ